MSTEKSQDLQENEAVPAEAETDEAAAELSRLEEEGEIAADYLEEFLDIADFDGDIDLDVGHGRALVAIVAEGNRNRTLQRLIGDEGEVVDALQDLTRLAVQTKNGERSRLMLDIGGFRENKRAHVVKLAREAIAKVRSSGEEVRMDPMNAFERKVVHDEVAAAGLFSSSAGDDPDRRVVITLSDE